MTSGIQCSREWLLSFNVRVFVVQQGNALLEGRDKMLDVCHFTVPLQVMFELWLNVLIKGARVAATLRTSGTSGTRTGRTWTCR